MRLRPIHHPPQDKMNVTPLIDVVMCLIIFYLMVGQLAAQRQMPVALPSSQTGSTQTSDDMVLSIVPLEGGQPALFLEEAPYTLDQLRTTLAAVGPTTQVTIRADRSLSYGQVQPIVQVCREAGLTSIRLATRPGEAERPQ